MKCEICNDEKTCGLIEVSTLDEVDGDEFVNRSRMIVCGKCVEMVDRKSVV